MVDKSALPRHSACRDVKPILVCRSFPSQQNGTCSEGLDSLYNGSLGPVNHYELRAGTSMSTSAVSDRELKKKRIITLVLMAIFLMSASFFLIDRKDETIIVVSFPNGRTLETEVADTPEKLLFGLAFRETLSANSGMLYIFESTGQNHVWTKGYQFPVDLLWIDESHHIVGLREQVAPCVADVCPSYSSSPESVRYAIQTEAGFIEREGIVVGLELKYTLRM